MRLPFRNRKTCLLFVGSQESFRAETTDIEWHVSDFDIFVENYSLWNKSEFNTDQFFSQNKVDGLKQNLANTKEITVCVVGERLDDSELLKYLKDKFIEFGYHVVVERNGRFEYFMNKNQEKVYLNLGAK